MSQRLEPLSGFGWGMPRCKKTLWNHSREPTGKLCLLMFRTVFYFFTAADHLKVSASFLRSFWWSSLVGGVCHQL